MGCSVVVITDGKKADLLVKCIDSLSKQTYKELETICVSRVDNLPEEVYQNSKVMVERRRGASLAKNVGIRSSNHDFLALTDDDCVCDPNWVENLISELGKERVGCVTGGTVPTREGLWYASSRLDKERRVFRKGTGFTPPWLMGAGNNVCFRKGALERIGLFDENLGPGTKFRGAEDIDVFHRIIEGGYDVVYSPEAVIHHEPLDTQHQVRKMMYGYRLGIGAFFAKNRSSKLMRTYFWKDYLKRQLRDSRNLLLGGNPRMGSTYFLGYLGALRGYFGFILAH
jgi:GT2 family glycosyltransferase